MILLRKLGDAFDAVMGLVEMVRSFDAVMGVAQNLEAEARLLRERVPRKRSSIARRRPSVFSSAARAASLEGERNAFMLTVEALNRRLPGE